MLEREGGIVFCCLECFGGVSMQCECTRHAGNGNERSQQGRKPWDGQLTQEMWNQHGSHVLSDVPPRKLVPALQSPCPYNP